MSYGLAFQLVFYSRDGVVTLSDSIDANPAFGDCSEPGESIEAALREVCVCVFVWVLIVRYRSSSESIVAMFFKNMLVLTRAHTESSTTRAE